MGCQVLLETVRYSTSTVITGNHLISICGTRVPHVIFLILVPVKIR